MGGDPGSGLGAAWWTLSTLCLGALMLAAMLVGPVSVQPLQLLQAVHGRLVGEPLAGAGQIDTVLFAIRLPRVAAALLVGAALSAAGATYQALFRNPLVSPDILGVSMGAGLGAALGIFFALPVLAMQGLAFASGLLTVALAYTVASAVRGHEPRLVLVLAGVVIGSLAGACISLLKILADPYDELPAITFWLLGSLANVLPEDIWSIIPVMLAGLAPLVALRWTMNVMTLGDEEAAALGVEPGRYRPLFIACATLMTAAAVAVAGVVGWVGLVMPHIARLVVGPDFRCLLPASMMMGAGFVLIVDTLARSLAGAETPLGILTAFVGAPVFLWLLVRGRRSW